MEIFVLNCVILSFLLALGIWALVGFLWSSFRKFFHRNYSFFDASFIMTYFLEQLILITLIFKFPIYTQFWAGAFAIIVITTASFQKLMSESRFKEISETTIEQKVLLERSSKVNEDLVDKNKELEGTIEGLKEFIEETL